jgi:hypothetical protein
MLLVISEAVSSDSRLARARLRKSAVVFLVGDLEGTARWYRQLGLEARLFPPGFGILRRDDVEIFLQQVDGYRRPADPAARERGAWDVYIETDDVAALNEEWTERADVHVTRRPTSQHYGQIEFDVLDPNGYLLVFAQPIG